MSPNKNFIAYFVIYEGLPGVLGNKGTLAKYRREQGNISQFLGTREQNSKNYSTKNSDIRNREHYFGVFIYGHLCTTVVPTLV